MKIVHYRPRLLEGEGEGEGVKQVYCNNTPVYTLQAAILHIHNIIPTQSILILIWFRIFLKFDIEQKTLVTPTQPAARAKFSRCGEGREGWRGMMSILYFC